MNTRVHTIACTLFGLTGALLAQDTAAEESFRYRWITIDVLHGRARKARVAYEVSLAEYAAIIRLLREEELAIVSEAGSHSFQDQTEQNYWRRSRLKFPSALQTELRLLKEGKDPAAARP